MIHRAFFGHKLRKYLREKCYEKVYLTRGLNRAIFMFTNVQWREAEARFRKKLFSQKSRLIFSVLTQEDLRICKYQHIPISEELRQYSQIQKDIIYVCWPNRIEIWAKELYRGAKDGTIVFNGFMKEGAEAAGS